jgi:hypothetical protein
MEHHSREGVWNLGGERARERPERLEALGEELLHVP